MEFMIYLLKVNVAILLFYSLYRLFFREDTFFQWKRIFLSGIIFLSLLYPLVKISLSFPLDRLSAGNFTFSNEVIIEKISGLIYSLPELIITGVSQSEQTKISFIHIISVIYLTGVILLFLRFFVQLISLIGIILQSKKSNYKEQTIYVKREIQTPFSFFGWIVLDPKQYTDSELTEILNHETAHVRQFHSLDALLSELFGIFCWFNPISWLLKWEIRMNLEYLADRSVIASGFDSEHYQFLLLQLCHHKAAAKLSNNFNVSPLKNRIIMMNKKKTSLWNMVKYVLFVPLIMLLVVISNCSDKASKNDNKNETTEIAIPEVDPNPVEIETVEVEPEKKQIYSHVETPPRFPGGETELMKWLHENIQYPITAMEQGIQGRTVVRFVVGPDGSVSDVEVVKSLNPALDKEAIRAVSEMPKWVPGHQKGKPVYVYYTLPILFKLSE